MRRKNQWLSPVDDHRSDIDDEGENDFNDDDLDVVRRQRSRSAGDAEDIVLNAYYESFTMDAQSTLPSSNGLHHRGTTAHNETTRNLPPRMSARGAPQTPTTHFGYEYYRTPTPKRKPSHSNYSNGLLLHTSNRRLNWKRWSFALALSLYIGWVVRSSVWLNRLTRETDDWEAKGPLMGSDLNGRSSSAAWNRPNPILRREPGIGAQQRAQLRRERTKPPVMSDTDDARKLAWYSVLRTDQQASSSQTHFPPSPSTPVATIDQLCGFHAQNASLANPQHYPANAALNSRSARVLITGILNPLGFNLAMHLHQRCGVQVIGGLDPMFPNSVEHRLQLIDRLQLLQTNIPKLVKPIVLPYIGLEPKGKDSKSQEEYDFMSWKPTHIVHLASYSSDVYANTAIDPSWRNLVSPYVTEDHTPSLYQLRSSLLSMEQLLQSIAAAPPEDRPQLVYASSAPPISRDGIVHATTKLIDEVLTQVHSIPSMALRFPNAIFGPWGQPGSPVHDLMEGKLSNWNSTTSTTAKLPSRQPKVAEESAQGPKLELLHVDDAIEAIVSGMQFKHSQPLAVDVTPTLDTTMTSLDSALDSLSHPTKLGSKSLPQLQSHPLWTTPSSTEGSPHPHHAVWEWKPRIPLWDGMINTMAWHLDRHAPFGPSVATADNFLEDLNAPACAAEDWQCHRGKHFLPCLSECNTRSECLPSVFDEVHDLVHDVSDGCDIVLYTASLGYNVEDLELHSEYMDDANLDDKDSLICNFAFIPRESDVVATVTGKVPNEELAKFGIKPQQGDGGRGMRERIIDGLNGRLLYRGWILIWVRDAVEPLSVTDKSLLKLSPGKLFSPGVTHAVFVEEDFAMSPNIEDILFLVEQMKRRPFPRRTGKKDVIVKTPQGNEIAKRKKFQLPSEPRRRAAMLLAPLRLPLDPKNPAIQRYKNGDKKLTVHDATKFMWYELDVDPRTEKEPADVRRQREFYEKIPSYVNRNTELRSTMEPWYRFSIHHWIRSRWVVHDLKLEDSRLLRCDWYQEHVQWGTDLDQLSFAHVMAARELKRRMAHMEPDDHVKTFIEMHPDLRDLTDSYEWHPMETEVNKLYREPVKWTSQLPEHVTTEEAAELAAEEALSEEGKGATPLYVRIMSEKVMTAARKAWTKSRKKLAKAAKKK